MYKRSFSLDIFQGFTTYITEHYFTLFFSDFILTLVMFSVCQTNQTKQEILSNPTKDVLFSPSNAVEEDLVRKCIFTSVKR